MSNTALATNQPQDVTTLNPGFEDMRPAVKRIKLSTRDRSKFLVDGVPIETFNANIQGGRNRYSAKRKGENQDYHNFNTPQELADYLDENPDWDASTKYQLTLALADEETPFLIDLPQTSAIAFHQYAREVSKSSRGMVQVVTNFSIEFVQNQQKIEYPRVKFECAGDITEDISEAADARAASTPPIPAGKHWSQVDESLQTFWKTMRAMGVQPVKVLEYLGVKDLLHYPDSMEDAVAQVTAKLF